MTGTTGRGRIGRGWRVALVAVVALAGCTRIEVRSDRDASVDLAAVDTYAWVEDPRPPDLAGTPVYDDGLVAKVQEAGDRELAAMGLRLVPEEGARLLVAPHLSVEVKDRFNDPFYEFYAIERYEEGTLRLEFLDASTEQRVWKGSASRRLRTVSQSVGMYAPKFVETSEERTWEIERLASAILDQFARAQVP